MTHKGKPHKRASKEELDKRRARQVEVKELKKRSDAGEDVRTKTKPKDEPIQLLAPKKEPSFADAAKRAVFGLEFDVPKKERRIAGTPVPIGPAGGLGIIQGFKGLIGKEATPAFTKTLESLKFIKVGGGLAVKKGGIRIIPGQFVKVIGKNAAIRNTFKANSKTQGLTSSLLGKVGLSIPAASILLGAIGSYPFAGFIKEEALQTLSFGTKVAIDAGDLEGAQASIDQVEEVLNPAAWEKIIGGIPYANIVKQLSEFYSAAALKNTNDQRALDKKRAVLEGEIESDFARERRISDEAAFERKREFGEEESERFAQIEADRTAAENEQKRLESIFFQLIRDKKFAEAEEFRKTNFPT